MDELTVTSLIEHLELTNYTPNIDTDEINITKKDINRMALQLTGFYDHFDAERVQIIGFVEYTYLEKQRDEERMHQIIDHLMSFKSPCVIFCRDLKPLDEFYEAAEKYGVPLLTTKRATSEFTAEIIRWLNEKLAPSISIHGVLVDVYGEGVLIMGESGIGKSEAALELIKRGHRLVSDDVVEIRKISDAQLVGTSPEVTRHFIELRGIGIIDVRTLFGVEHVKEYQNIDLVIKLEDWNRDADYDRFGLDEQYTEILGNKVVCHNIPIRPGRNLAVIVESAAVNHRQKKMGYNAAQELYNRVTENIRRKEEEQQKKLEKANAKKAREQEENQQ